MYIDSFYVLTLLDGRKAALFGIEVWEEILGLDVVEIRSLKGDEIGKSYLEGRRKNAEF